MIKATSIMIDRVEGPSALCTKKTLTGENVWQKAQSLLLKHSDTSPKNGGYDKCDFIVTFADGETYQGRYDLKHHSVELPSLEQHMLNFLNFIGGKNRAWASEKEYAEIMARDPQRKEDAIKFLNTYAIGDVA